MNTDEFLSFVDNPIFIPGIYNYCDRWCERCHMTSRCSLYAMEVQENKNSDRTDDDHSKFLEQVKNSFAIVHELLARYAEENGISLESTPESVREFEIEEKRRKSFEKSPLSVLGKQYMQSGRAWLDKCETLFKDKETELMEAEIMDLPNREPMQESLDIKDAYEILCFYVHQIYIKSLRAQTGKRDEVLLDDDGKPFPKDSDGSAKVALIGIDRSMAAWGILLTHFPEQEDAILPLLTLLERIRRMVEKEFPDARAFYREGLDD
jgi:hypothetical protein